MGQGAKVVSDSTLLRHMLGEHGVGNRKDKVSILWIAVASTPLPHIIQAEGLS